MVEPLKAYRTLVGVGLGCGLLIATVFESTRGPISRNQAQALQNAINAVLPGSETRVDLAVTEQNSLAEISDPTGGADGYLARDVAGNLLGYAIIASGMGYQDQIRLLYGYDPVRECLTGYVVLDSRETPGLGSRISTDAAFLKRFQNLPMPLEGQGEQAGPRLTVVRPGASAQPWEIDGITGATVSSRAVASILNDSLTQWLPRIADRGAL